jgi:hypothetical protein
MLLKLLDLLGCGVNTEPIGFKHGITLYLFSWSLCHGLFDLNLFLPGNFRQKEQLIDFIFCLVLKRTLFPRLFCPEESFLLKSIAFSARIAMMQILKPVIGLIFQED